MLPEYVFQDLPAAAFPFHVEAISETTGEVVWSQTVEGPGSLAVPNLKGEYGPVAVRITTGNGGVTYMGSNGELA